MIPAWQPEASSETLSFWVSCASLHRLPGSLAPACLSSLIANPCTTLPLICFFSPLQLCMQLIPSWLIPPNPLSISNVKFYKLLPPITPHTGQAVRGSCLCSHKMLIPLSCHDLFSSPSPSVDCELLENRHYIVFILIFPSI